MVKNLTIMTAEQSKLMSEWVKDGLELINKRHEEFHKMIINQYPDEDYVFQQSIVVNCVCSVIARMGIEYLKMSSFYDIDISDINRLLTNALTNELNSESSQTKQ